MVQVGDITIGEGKPKICASITESDRKSIIAAADILLQKRIDIAEWRIDFFDDVDDLSMVSDVLNRLKMSLFGKPLLVTFRTGAEGGQRDIPTEKYRELLEYISASGCAQMVDVEIFKDIPYEKMKMADEDEEIKQQLEELQEWIQGLREKVTVVGSYHDFQRTPDNEELVGRLEWISRAGADIPKLAVMPENKMDVLRLMAFTLQESESLQKPLITMSMGSLGSISRIAGETFGSSVTFGSIGQASAPGQLAVDKLEQLLEMIHQNY